MHIPTILHLEVQTLLSQFPTDSAKMQNDALHVIIN